MSRIARDECDARLTAVVESARGSRRPGRCVQRASSLDLRSLEEWAVSSAVEHCFHTAGATGSIPVPPTNCLRSCLEQRLIANKDGVCLQFARCGLAAHISA